WFRAGTIPGAVHMPYTEVVDRLGELDCEPDFDGWDCEAARKVALFCNGLWCGQSPTAIRAMIAAGYPSEKIYYYRGGMQSWRLLGLTVITPGE
ncbi:rhodanese-like domain-containing protein, partial [Escherichia coli]|nr:rhodanese-like domain-containing protein [Escherichia coli]